MGNFIKHIYQCSDLCEYNNFHDAWKHEHQITFPNILMFDIYRNITNKVESSFFYIVNNDNERDFIEEYLDNQRWACICDYYSKFTEPNSVIIYLAERPGSYYLYSPSIYKNKDNNYYESFWQNISKNSDLYNKLMG